MGGLRPVSLVASGLANLLRYNREATSVSGGASQLRGARHMVGRGISRMIVEAGPLHADVVAAGRGFRGAYRRDSKE